MFDINGSVYRGLCEQFPHAEVRPVDIDKLIKAKPWIIAINLLVACWSYGLDMIRKKRNLDESFFGTGYIFRKIRELAHQVHSKWPADFSFQTWSMFDFSTPGTPHFVYTDHTYLSCRDYPAYGTAIWSPIRRDKVIDLERTIFENAAGIFTWSSNVTETLIREYGIPADKILCVRAGPNVDYERACQIPITLDRYRNKRIVIVGRQWELKGGPELLAAFRRVLRVHSDAKLTIIGCNPPIKEPSVEVVGEVPLEQVLEYLAQSTVYCMPTRMEPFGIIFLEALASGLPVVCWRLGAAPDFVIKGQTGTVIEHGDIEGLAQALISLLDDPEKCQRYAMNARELVQKDYSWDNVFEKIGDRISTIVKECTHLIQPDQLLNQQSLMTRASQQVDGLEENRGAGV